MKISDFNDESIIKYLKITDFENFLNVHVDTNDYYFYNLNSSLYFDISNGSLLEYVCTINMHWPLISYKIYGTTRLTWLLWKLNDVKLQDIFKMKHPGDKILYLSKEYTENIVAQINDFDI